MKLDRVSREKWNSISDEKIIFSCDSEDTTNPLDVCITMFLHIEAANPVDQPVRWQHHGTKLPKAKAFVRKRCSEIETGVKCITFT